jgi:hypothetical protein
MSARARAALAAAGLLAGVAGVAGGVAARPQPQPPAPGLPRGEVVPRVVCAADPTTSYALYLPQAYRPDRRWPIVYVFDSRGIPGDRAMIELFLAGAERFGWVVASANESSGLVPMEENIGRMRRMWVDTHDRLALDERRAYGFGFSGMSRTMTTLAMAAPGTFAGVIGAGSGFPVGRPPTREAAFPFFGVIGDRDFSYHELMELEGKLAAAGTPHRVHVFDGSHQWPPEPVVTLAMGWMELQAMREGRREKDTDLVAALWAEELARALAHEAGGRVWHAWRAYRALAADFAGLRPTGEAERKVAAIEAGDLFQRDRKARDRRDRRDVEHLARAPAVFAAAGLDPRPGGVERLLADLDVPALRARRDGDDPEERLAAARVLYALYIQAGLYLPREAMAAGQWDRAILFLETAAALDPESGRIPYRLATAYAGKGEVARALAALEKAVAMGGTDLAEIESDPALAPVRGTEAYRTLIAKLRAAPPPPAD